MSRAKTKRPGTRGGVGGKRTDSVMRESYDRVELATADAAALDDMLTGSVSPVPASTHHTLDDEQLVEETVLPEVPTLRFAVLEDAAHVATAQAAIVAAGHSLAGSASGANGVARIQDLVSNGGADAVLVALPGGEKVIDAALALAPRRPVAIAAITAGSIAAVRRATTAGADLVAPRPHDVDRLSPILLAAARLHAERHAALAARGSEQLLRARLDEITDSEPGGLETFEMFQRVLEREIKRARRFEYPLSVALFAVEIAPPPPPPGIRGILRARAGNALVHAIRDIDLATQLDHERFLVLLPYTDLANATTVARRIIAAVGAGESVIAAGRSFPPRVVGAVAGGRVTAEPISFAKLVKDATRALEQARKDGAELAVQP